MIQRARVVCHLEREILQCRWQNSEIEWSLIIPSIGSDTWNWKCNNYKTHVGPDSATWTEKCPERLLHRSQPTSLLSLLRQRDHVKKNQFIWTQRNSVLVPSKFNFRFDLNFSPWQNLLTVSALLSLLQIQQLSLHPIQEYKELEASSKKSLSFRALPKWWRQNWGKTCISSPLDHSVRAEEDGAHLFYIQITNLFLAKTDGSPLGTALSSLLLTNAGRNSE